MSGRTKELLCVCVLVAFALALRIEYQNETITNNALRPDAYLYYSAAYNLRYHSAYSIDPPSAQPPETRTDLAPGYPLFLSVFFPEGQSGTAPLQRVRNIQVLFGALIVLFTYVTARQSLDRPWALVAGLLTAISPHLIAVQEYILTESLFTFMMMLGVLVLLMAWRRELPALALLGGILVAASAQIRTISIALAFVLTPLLLIAPRPSSTSSRWSRVLAAGLVLVGVLIVWGSHRVFVNQMVMNVNQTAIDGETIQQEPTQYTAIATPSAYLRNAVRPPRFMVAGTSHIQSRNRDPLYKAPTTASFWEAPTAYLKWNLGWRLFYLWHFDNAYNGDVYIYPMTRTGFQENPFLGFLHRTMRAVHWPLFGLAAVAPLLLLARVRRGLSARDRSLLMSLLGFAYFVGVLMVTYWLPRYSIPARPFSYILAAATLSWVVAWGRTRGLAWWRAQEASERAESTARGSVGSEPAG